MAGRRRSLVSAVVCCVAVLLAGACRPLPLGGPVGEVGSTSTEIGCDLADQGHTLTSDTHLDPECTYTRTFRITASSVTLDCRGARIEDGLGTQGHGVHIEAAAGTALTDVTVRNCHVDGFLNSIRVTRSGFRTLPAGGEYEAPFERILLENNRLVGSRGSGVFVNAYVTGVTIQDNVITESGSVGIYLEAGSMGSIVQRNRVHGNGYGEVDLVNGVPFDLGGTEVRLFKTGREGIAIDGSRNNLVVDNDIYGNSAGGIFLYKNCGELSVSRPADVWTRRYGANDNVIQGNRLGSQPQGIWVGSRMAENQHFMECSDPAYLSGPLLAVHRDAAARTTISGNTLVGIGNAIRVEDDDTVVQDNTIISDDPAGRGVLIGTKHRTEVLGEPVDGTVVEGNTVVAPPGFDAFTWIHGHTATTFGANTASEAPASLEPGSQPTINPWLTVLRVQA